ncbi:MAG: hypothetical protein M3345_04355 [Actinomycetota bacterium]|nr:hypothetical protein [Actinomycetota bacterium]
MTTDRESRPLVSEKLRMPLRIVAVGLAYVVYRVAQPPLGGGIFAGAGTVLLTWAVIDRWTLWRRDRSGLLQVGTTVLGIGLLLLGAYLHLR